MAEDAPEEGETKVLEDASTACKNQAVGCELMEYEHELDLKEDYDESKESNYAPGEGETKVLEDASTTCNNQAIGYKLME